MATKKFIPNGDLDFAGMARVFADAVRREPRVYAVAPEDAEKLNEAVTEFREALSAARGGGSRSQSRGLTAEKDAKRKDAERWVRRIAGAVRSNPEMSDAQRAALGLPTKERKRAAALSVMHEAAAVLKESPTVRFERALRRAAHVPEHELVFERRGGLALPAGLGFRLELFFELVPPEDAVPERPGGSGFGCHYLRSYAKSPVVLTPPLADRPMRVVYWGRWADASGAVGPMSAAAAGWVEGGSHHLIGLQGPGSANAKPAEVDTSRLAAVAAKLPRLVAVPPEGAAQESARLSEGEAALETAAGAEAA